MPILSNSELVPEVIPGIDHRTLAGAEHGLRHLAVWSQRMAPGGATPPHYHDCEEVVIVLEGAGTVDVDGQPHPVRAGDTVIVPAGVPHQIINTGTLPLRTLASLSSSDVKVYLPDGQLVQVPWN